MRLTGRSCRLRDRRALAALSARRCGSFVGDAKNAATFGVSFNLKEADAVRLVRVRHRVSAPTVFVYANSSGVKIPGLNRTRG